MKFRRVIGVVAVSLVVAFGVDLIVAAMGSADRIRGTWIGNVAITHTYKEARGWPLRSVVYFRSTDDGTVQYVAHDWLPTAINIVVYASMIVLLSFAGWRIHQRFRPATGHCPTCGYDLSHADHAACPECGAEVIMPATRKALPIGRG